MKMYSHRRPVLTAFAMVVTFFYTWIGSDRGKLHPGESTIMYITVMYSTVTLFRTEHDRLNARIVLSGTQKSHPTSTERVGLCLLTLFLQNRNGILWRKSSRGREGYDPETSTLIVHVNSFPIFFVHSGAVFYPDCIISFKWKWPTGLCWETLS